MPFVKGVSGNPAGRRAENPDTSAAKMLARRHTHEAMRMLVKIMKSSTSDSARIIAAEAILDRGWGKPAHAVSVSGPDGGPVQIEAVREAERFASRILSITAR